MRWWVKEILFQVNVAGSSPPKLVWYHNGEEVVPDYSREIMKDGSLSMPSVMRQERRTERLSCMWRMRKE